MAPKKQGVSKQEKKTLTRILAQYGLHGDYLALIDAAVRGEWNTDQFFHRVVHTNAFQKEFPGVVVNGSISPGLSSEIGQATTASNLKKALGMYRGLHNAFQQQASLYGYGKVDKKLMGALLKAQVSPQEFNTRLQAIQTIENNPQIETQFNDYLKAAGQQPLDKMGLYHLAAGNSDKQFYNYYEAAQIAAGGTGVQGAEALAFAKRGLPPGQALDLGDLVTKVRENLGTISSEMGQQGISNSELLSFVANPNGNPDLAGKINQILQTRKSLGGSYVPGYQNKKGAGGGPTQYDQGGQAAYG